MEITIKGEPKEVAALVLAVQERQINLSEIKIDGKELSHRLQQSLKEECTRDHLCT